MQEFFATHPVFSYEEFGAYLADRGSRNVKTRKALLRKYAKAGRILRVRRGLYVTVPLGQTSESVRPDPFLLAARATPDAVLAYHTALEFHGKAYSAFHDFYYLTALAARTFQFAGETFKRVAFPKELVRNGQEYFGLELAERAGLDVRVTGLERTMVDVLNRPALGGGWEELWRSLESVEYFDLEQVVDYAVLLGNATTVAKVGFYLQQHAEALMVDEAYLDRLRSHTPRKPHYMDRSAREPGRLVDSWNLVVPVRVLERSWEEVG